MNKNYVIQSILDLYERPRYLELGNGIASSFSDIKANEKVIVDPQITVANVTDSTFVSVHSNDYFETISNETKYDVVFISDRHDFAQSLRDFLNAWAVTSENGVIVLDNCIPNSYESSLSDFASAFMLKKENNVADESWMGDVYKLIFFIDCFMSAVSFANIVEANGVVVTWKKHREFSNRQKYSDIEKLSYVDVVKLRKIFNDDNFHNILYEISKNIQAQIDPVSTHTDAPKSNFLIS